MVQGARINLFSVLMTPEASAAAVDVLHSGYIGQGKKVQEFEAALARRLESPHVVTANSGTAALHLALHLLGAPDPQTGWPGIAANDEVITTPMTCVATNWPILATGHAIHWADIDPDNFAISLDSIAAALSERTKAIVVVHWGGYPVDLVRLEQIVGDAERRFGFRPAIIEDCAHAFGSRLHGRAIGSSSNFCAFSFQAVKTLTCGDGGVLVVPDARRYERARRLRWFGIDRDTDGLSYHDRNVEEWGFKFHMNDINASIGLGNLTAVDAALARQRGIAARYDDALADCPGVRRPARTPGHESTHFLYTVRVEDRIEFERALDARGIEARRVHSRNDWHSTVSGCRRPLPVLDSIYEELVCIPVGWWLTDEDVGRVIAAVKAGW